MSLIGNRNGVINSFHQACSDDEDFLEKLEMLEYDLLYGKGYAYGSKGKYPTNPDMTLGTRGITIESYEIVGETLYIKGKNFTKFSEITLDGDEQDTVFIDSETLATNYEKFKKITVRQISDKGDMLGETDPIYKQ